MKSHTLNTGPLLLSILCLLLASGCNSKLLPLSQQSEAPVAPLPERVYQQPPYNTYANARVAVFRFFEPPHLTDVGYNAANSLYQALAQHSIFSSVSSEVSTQSPSLTDQLDTALAKHYDLIITGSVDYYLDGTQYQESRVDVAIWAYDVKTAAIVWHAAATARSQAQAGKDYYLFKTKGKIPLPATALIEMNTEKFINMFASSPESH